MDISKKDFLKAKILFKLARKEIYGGKHLSIDDLKHGFKRHEVGDVEDIIEALIKSKLLLSKPAHYGKQIMINLEYSKEIKEFIKKILGNLPPFADLLKWMKL